MMPAATHTVRHVVVDFPLGPLTLVRDGAGFVGIYFPGHWTRPDETAFRPRADPAEDSGFGPLVSQLREYFTGGRRTFELNLDPRGSERSREVWRRLAEIPYGETTTNGALAKQIGGGISPRAVGGFVGHNPLSIVIPCHRVVGSTGALTGYAGGLDRKRKLLELEQAIPVSEPTLW